MNRKKIQLLLVNDTFRDSFNQTIHFTLDDRNEPQQNFQNIRLILQYVERKSIPRFWIMTHNEKEIKIYRCWQNLIISLKRYVWYNICVYTCPAAIMLGTTYIIKSRIHRWHLAHFFCIYLLSIIIISFIWWAHMFHLLFITCAYVYSHRVSGKFPLLQHSTSIYFACHVWTFQVNLQLWILVTVYYVDRRQPAKKLRRKFFNSIITILYYYG